MQQYDFHPAAACFPLQTADAFAHLLQSMRQHGYDPLHPLVLCEGLILDRRHRYRACQELGLEPTVTTYTGNPYEKAWRDNGARRDLAAGQKAAIRLKLELASNQWQAGRRARQGTANAQRRAAAQRQPRQTLASGKQGFAGRSSRDERPQKPTAGVEPAPAHTRLAAAAGVSPKTAERALGLAKQAPELLDQVAAGTLTLNAATHQVKRAAMR